MYQLAIFDDWNKVYTPINQKIYGKEYTVRPHIPSKPGVKYLAQLLPLEQYQNIFVLLSGGKDSIAALLYLLRLGVPKEKITLVHHCIDGRGTNPILEMDWACTKEYCLRLAQSLGIKIKFSWREEGFAGEMFRFGAAKPIAFEEFNEDKITVTNGANWERSQELQKLIIQDQKNDEEENLEEHLQELKSLGYRMKWPAKTASLSTRWCSSALKIEVFDRVLRYAKTTMSGCKVLVVDGIRREESTNRSRYNEMELHNCNALTKQRIIHHWRPVIEWTEEMVWDILKEFRIRPHACYSLGFNRCSCAMCIFSLPQHFQAIRKLMPDRFCRMCELEKELGFTLDSKGDLMSYIGNTKSCLPDKYDTQLVEMINTGKVPSDYVQLKPWEIWTSPIGAFHGSAGGPC